MMTRTTAAVHSAVIMCPPLLVATRPSLALALSDDDARPERRQSIDRSRVLISALSKRSVAFCTVVNRHCAADLMTQTHTHIAHRVRIYFLH